MTVRYYVVLVAFRVFFDLYRPCICHLREKNARNITLEGLSLFILVIFRVKHDLLFRFYSTFA